MIFFQTRTKWNENGNLECDSYEIKYVRKQQERLCQSLHYHIHLFDLMSTQAEGHHWYGGMSLSMPPRQCKADGPACLFKMDGPLHAE